VTRPPPPERARYGDACSSCGQCCESSLCPLGRALFGRAAGPCPALGYDEAAKSFCGLIVNPASFAHINAALYGRDALSAGAVILCGAGMGCDAAKEGEFRPPHVQQAMLKKCDAIPRAQVARAMRVWRITR